MQTVILTTLAVGALVLALASPLFVIAWREGRRDTLRNFGLGGVGVAVLCGFLAGASERQVQQCLDAGNSDCVDSGTIGLQIVFVVLYVISAWSVGYLMWRD